MTTRNYLRADQSKKLHKGSKRHWVNSSLAISLILVLATLFVTRYVHAAGSCTSAANSSILTDARVGGSGARDFNGNLIGSLPGNPIDEWTSGSFAYRVYDLYTFGDPASLPAPGADSGQTCSVSFHVDAATNAAFWMNGVKPVDVRLGVPNMGAQNGPEGNNFGIWALGTNVGTTPYYRPPQYDNNFRSYAAFADDGAMATIASSVRNTAFRTLWCQSFNPGAPGAGGVGLLAGDTGSGCPPDTTYAGPPGPPVPPQPLAGAGYMFVSDNCEFGQHGVSATDRDSTSVGCNNPSSMTSKTTQNSWYWDPFMTDSNGGWNSLNSAAPAVTAVTNAGTPKENLSLRGYVGCNNGGTCNGLNQKLDNFTIHQYARNHAFSGAVDAHSMSAQTILTFAYPIPSQITVSKHANGCVFKAGTSPALGLSGCPGLGSAVIFVSDDPVSNFSVNVTDLVAGTQTLTPVEAPLSAVQIVDDLPNPVTSTVTYNQAATLASPNCNNPPNVPPPVFNGGSRLTWDLSPAELGSINPVRLGGGGATLQLCYFINVGSPAAALSAFSNTATSCPTATACPITTTGLQAVSTNSVITNYISGPVFPYIYTTFGDVNAGGNYQSGCVPPLGNGTPFIQGQSQGGTPSSGYYVVSAGGSISNFVSGNQTGAGNTLQAQFYSNICRPDMINLAQTTTLPKTDSTAAPTAAILSAGGSQAGKLLFHNGTVTISGNPSISGRVTLFVNGDLIIRSNINVPDTGGVSVNANLLNSFGVIVAGNVYIDHNVTKLDGFYFEGGTNNAVYTCTDTAPATPTIYSTIDAAHTAALAANCQSNLTLNGFLSARGFDFNRVGTLTNPIPQATETFNYSGLLYIAPPPLFDGGLTAGTTKSFSIEPPQY